MIKSILYTSNPNFVPTTLEQVSNFAEENGKFMTCFAKEGTELYSVEEGAHILSSKGNHIYVLETGGDYSYAKKSNIIGVVQVEVVVATAPALPDETVFMAGNKQGGVEGFHIACVAFFEQGFNEFWPVNDKRDLSDVCSSFKSLFVL